MQLLEHYSEIDLGKYAMQYASTSMEFCCTSGNVAFVSFLPCSTGTVSNRWCITQNSRTPLGHHQDTASLPSSLKFT